MPSACTSTNDGRPVQALPLVAGLRDAFRGQELTRPDDEVFKSAAPNVARIVDDLHMLATVKGDSAARILTFQTTLVVPVALRHRITRSPTAGPG